MHKLPNIIVYFSIFFVFSISNIAQTYAFVLTQGRPVEVSGTVGQFYLNLSGMIAPYASVVLISNDIVLRSTVADANGYFFLSQILINKGFSQFCLDAIDFKRLGESYTCFNIPPANGDVTMKNIFLPPTLGLQRTEINAGSDAVAWGYSMPNAIVTIHLSDGRTFSIQADATGYYEFHIPISKAGTYQLFADATLAKQKSLQPDRKTTLTALSVPQQVGNFIIELLKKLLRFLIGSPWGIVLILLPIIILIIILLRKLKPEWFTFIDKEITRMESHIPFIQHKLHHWWFVGY